MEEHARLLQASWEAISQLTQHNPLRAAADTMLLHADFHKRNIFVSESDPTVITGVINWTSTNIQPAFMYALDIPDFACMREDLPFLKGLASAMRKEDMSSKRLLFAHRRSTSLRKDTFQDYKPGATLSQLYPDSFITFLLFGLPELLQSVEN